MKTIICKKSEAVLRAADLIAQTLNRKPDAVLAMACGQTMEPVWGKLAEMVEQGELSFSEARILCVTEFMDVQENMSCRYALQNGLLRFTDIPVENSFFPDMVNPESYDTLIADLGGIDLAVLGIGENCHIGYNEPGTLYDSKTHLQKLTGRTKQQLLRRGFSEDMIPQSAMTMGIKTLTSARGILILAFGGDKAAAVYQMVYAKTTSYIPAAYLQIPLEVTALLDTEAAKEL